MKVSDKKKKKKSSLASDFTGNEFDRPEKNTKINSCKSVSKS